MGIADRLRADALRHVQAGTIDGRPLWWQVRRVVSADLVEAGYPFIVAVRAMQAADKAAVGLDGGLTNEEVIEAALSPKRGDTLREQARYREALACAGAVAFVDLDPGVTPDGSTRWEPVTLIRRESDARKVQHPLLISQLPVDAPVLELLSEAVLAHSGEVRAADALATFRRALAGEARPGGTTLRDPPVSPAPVDPV